VIGIHVDGGMQEFLAVPLSLLHQVGNALA
jgi:hypothetical protein